jgi:hypothetical protein
VQHCQAIITHVRLAFSDLGRSLYLDRGSGHFQRSGSRKGRRALGLDVFRRRETNGGRSLPASDWTPAVGRGVFN